MQVNLVECLDNVALTSRRIPELQDKYETQDSKCSDNVGTFTLPTQVQLKKVVPQVKLSAKVANTCVSAALSSADKGSPGVYGA